MRFNRASILSFFVIFCVGFFAASYYATNPEVLIVLRSLQAASSFAVAIRYWSLAIEAWRANFKTSTHVYAFSIELLAQDLGYNALWLWWWRAADEPRWMVDSPVNGFFVLVAMVALVGKLTAPEVRDFDMPENPAGTKRAIIYIIGTLVVACALSIVGLTSETTATKLADLARPWLAGDGVTWPSP